MEEVRTTLRRPLPREYPVTTDPGNFSKPGGGGYGPLPLNGSKEVVKNLLREESGAAAVEYGLLMAFIALAIIGAVTTFGSAVLKNLFDRAATSFPK
jgi:pilus assembly protein Flp/PilA